MRNILGWLLDWDGQKTGKQTVRGSGKAEHGHAAPRDGVIAVQSGRLMVTDPENGGRFPVIQARPGIIIRLNGDVLDEPLPVSSVDTLDWSLAPAEEQPFYRLIMEPDQMAVTLELLQDPGWYADDIVLLGESDVVATGEVRQRDRPRSGSPEQLIRQELSEMGVAYGLSDELIAELVKKAADGWRGAEVVARGQGEVRPVATRWAWIDSTVGITAPGQVIGTCTPGTPNVPRIDVTGIETYIYTNPTEPEVVLGQGVRRLPNGQLVSTKHGRLVIQQKDTGHTDVDVVPVRVINDVLAPGTALDTEGDIIIACRQVGITVTTNGTVICTADIKDTEISAQRIDVHGVADGCRLRTVAAGHPAPFLGFLKVLSRQLNDLGAVSEDHARTFRRIQTTVMQMHEFIRNIPMNEGEVVALIGTYFTTMMRGPERVSDAVLTEMGRDLAARLAKWEEEATVMGDIALRAGAAKCIVWSGGEVLLGGQQAYKLMIYAGKDIKATKDLKLQESELHSARRIEIAGTAGSPNRPTTLRAYSRVSIGEATANVVVEMGFQTYKFKTGFYDVTATLSARNEIHIKQGT